MTPREKILPNADAYVQVNVEKLIQIANIHGNLIILNENARIKALESLESKESMSFVEAAELYKEDFKEQLKLFAKDTDDIDIIIKSERFGKKIKLRIPHNMKVWASLDFLIETLGLPQIRVIAELGISILFSYSLYKEFQLDRYMSLREAGVNDGDELRLHIDISIKDPLLQKAEYELIRMHNTRFYGGPSSSWLKRMKILETEVAKLRQKSQKLHDQYIKSVVGEPWFAHLGPKPHFEISEGYA